MKSWKIPQRQAGKGSLWALQANTDFVKALPVKKQDGNCPVWLGGWKSFPSMSLPELLHICCHLLPPPLAELLTWPLSFFRWVTLGSGTWIKWLPCRTCTEECSRWVPNPAGAAPSQCFCFVPSMLEQELDKPGLIAPLKSSARVFPLNSTEMWKAALKWESYTLTPLFQQGSLSPFPKS